MTTATLTLAERLAEQTKIVELGEYNERSGVGGYRIIGHLIELRHEVARDANSPGSVPLVQETSEDAAAAARALKKTGISMDWKHFHNGPQIALDRSRTQILIIGRVPKLPEIPDPDAQLTQFVNTDYGRVPAAVLSAAELKERGITLDTPRMVKQTFTEHMSGTFGKFMVCRPLTQALYKVDGLIGLNLINFASDTYSGESPTFFLDPTNGEGHILGGQFYLG
jgi:hypothetical protein